MTATAAETVEGAEDRPDVYPATVVDRYAKVGVGWVFVYEDGRVLWHRYPRSDLTEEGHKAGVDILERLSPESPEYADFVRLGVLERRLTADGLDRVKSGAVPASAFLRAFVAGANPLNEVEWKGGASLPAGLWAEPEFRAYAPSRYMLCPTRPLRGQPASVRELLRGRERTYQARGRGIYGDEEIELKCFEVSSEEASVLWEGVPGLELSLLLPHGEPFMGEPG